MQPNFTKSADGLIPVIIQDEKTQKVLMLGYMNQEAFQKITKGKGVLVTLPESLRMTKRAFRNLPYVGIEEARNVHALEAMRYKFIMISKDALGVFHM